MYTRIMSRSAMSNQFINLVEILWVHLFILAIILDGLIDCEPGQSTQRPPVVVESYGSSILLHLPKG